MQDETSAIFSPTALCSGLSEKGLFGSVLSYMWGRFVRAPLSDMEAKMVHFAITLTRRIAGFFDGTRRKNEDTVEGLKDREWIRDRRMRIRVRKGDPRVKKGDTEMMRLAWKRG